MPFIPVHPKKTLYSNVLRLAGNLKFFKPVQPKNASAPIFIRRVHEEKSTACKSVRFLKAFLAISVTSAGMTRVPEGVCPPLSTPFSIFKFGSGPLGSADCGQPVINSAHSSTSAGAIHNRFIFSSIKNFYGCLQLSFKQTVTSERVFSHAHTSDKFVSAQFRSAHPLICEFSKENSVSLIGIPSPKTDRTIGDGSM